MDVTPKKPTSFSAHLDDQYGKPGTAEREHYEEEFEAFKLAANDPLFLADIREIHADFDSIEHKTSE